MDYRYEARVNFEDAAFDDTTNRLIRMRIIESAHQYVPVLEIDFLSYENVLTGSPLYDGQKITVVFRSTEKNIEAPVEETMTFRVFNYTIRHKSINEATVRVSALLDLPDMFAAVQEAIPGTSGAVFRQIAERMDVPFDIDESNDQQTWIRPGIIGAEFLNDVANHAWGGTGSFYAWASRRSGELAMKDIAKSFAREQSDWQFEQLIEESRQIADDERTIYFIDPVITSASGTMNNHFGYGMQLDYYDLTGEQSTTRLESLSKPTANIQVNRDMSSYRNRDTLPLLTGNTHPNFPQAYYQNNRYRSLFSTLLKCSSSYPRNVHLLETADVNMPTTNTEDRNERHSNRYLVTKVVTYIDFERNTMLAAYGLATTGIGGDQIPVLY